VSWRSSAPRGSSSCGQRMPRSFFRGSGRRRSGGSSRCWPGEMISSATADRRARASALGIIAAVVLGTAGCGGSRPALPPPASNPGAPDSGLAGSEPLRAVSPPDSLAAAEPGKGPVSRAEAALLEPVLDSSHLISGYRVQIFTTSWLQEAEKLRDELRQQGIAAYVEYRSPLYRVRIGDCTEIAEARELRDRAVVMGYDRATVVSTLVQRPAGASKPSGTP
jgi:cell division septation protein DedD